MAGRLNGIILVDKAEGWTSHDVVAKLRGISRERRIGHSGTLDPMATGLLVCFLGRATRAVEFAETHDKTYTAGLRLGIVTDTLDTSGTVLQRFKTEKSISDVKAILPEFTGEISQVPPMYSAIKKDGKKLYELARAGIETERKPRQVRINALTCTGMDGEDFVLEISCSKGTYIRTLCSDIGERLGCGAAMSSLRRTKAGRFDVSDAVTLETIEGKGVEPFIKKIDTMFFEYPQVIVDMSADKKIRNGVSFYCGVSPGKYRVYNKNGEFLMLGQVENKIMSTIKSFFEVDT